MQEIWKDIKDYKNYEVSNLGNVRNKKTKKILHQYINHNNNNFVTLYDEYKEKRTIIIHRIVANAFIENINNAYIVKHKDGNKQNNKVDNLEWR